MRAYAAALFALIAAPCFAQALPEHRLHVVLHPQQHSLEAEDRVFLPPDAPRTISFALHGGLHPSSPDALIEFAGDIPGSTMQRYRVTLPRGRDGFTLDYRGEIFQPPQQDMREARSFASTSGIISGDGTVLAGDSGWYPDFGGMLTFSLDVDVPPGWLAVSQGRRDAAGNPGAGADAASPVRVRWVDSKPQDEIYLIAAPFTVYAREDGGIESLVYLRSADAALAQRYLEATARYIAMYRRLIGPYPYAKFALVENFWETGYGMPSFTLLGSQVIRLPFIIDSSYPHEILHNWWGNGVFVDYAGGNWSEGLTAYLADHLLQEQKGNGAEFRRSTLQKYADFVSAGRDFPLTRFTSRHSPQTEAVGYGKAMMLFHMLRRRLGDAAFMQALQDFYRDCLFKRASFSDLEREFSRVSGKDLGPFFAQWVQRTGAPQLRLDSARAERGKAGYELTVKVEQTQPGPAYALDVPLAVTLAGQDAAYTTVLEMRDKQAEWHLPLAGQPLRVDVDPEFDVFRRLDRGEIPPALSQVFGAEKLLIVLPRKASDEMRAQFQAIAQAWQQQPSRATLIEWDDEVGKLPGDGSVWLFGAENRFRGEFQNALVKRGEMLSEGGVWLARDYDSARDALVLTTQIGSTPVAWLSAPDAAQLPVLARKLPHYSKFSYAAFNGADSTNLIKGVWPVTGSPLGIAVTQPDGGSVEVSRAKLPLRESLAR